MWLQKELIMPAQKKEKQTDDQPVCKAIGVFSRRLDSLLSCGMSENKYSASMRRIRFSNIFAITTVAALLVFSLANFMS